MNLVETCPHVNKSYKKLQVSDFLLIFLNIYIWEYTEQISVKIIEKVENGDHLELANREIYWQHQMRCYVQNGGGGHCYRKEK